MNPHPSLFKHIVRSKTFRIVVGLIIAFILAGIIFTLSFMHICGSAQPNFKPVPNSIDSSTASMENKIEGYHRTVETTYFTYPEWYLVFNPQEYASYLSNHLASGFPYFASVNQAWYGYCQVYGITKRNYPSNSGDQLVEAVIVTSFSVENIIKGVYENTVGRVSEFLAGGQRTAEDDYAAKVAKEYGDFIPTEPWYEFPFGKKFVGLWRETPFFGPHFVRKIERKFFLSLEYGVKTVYARVIEFGTHTAYGIADTEVYARVRNIPSSAFTNPEIKKVRDLGDDSMIVTLPHYQGFTDTAPGLAQKGMDFEDVAGASEILMTVIAPVDWKYDLKSGSELFSMNAVTDKTLKRVAIQAPVKSLGEMIRQLNSEHIQVEHLYDY